MKKALHVIVDGAGVKLNLAKFSDLFLFYYLNFFCNFLLISAKGNCMLMNLFVQSVKRDLLLNFD